MGAALARSIHSTRRIRLNIEDEDDDEYSLPAIALRDSGKNKPPASSNSRHFRLLEKMIPRWLFKALILRSARVIYRQRLS